MKGFSLDTKKIRKEIIPDDADVIIALATGYRKDGPGDSNWALARIVKEQAKKLSLPIIIQGEISDCEPPEFPIIKGGFNITIRHHRIHGKYLDSVEFMRQAREECDYWRWKNIVIVAHPYHIWRVWLIAKFFGFKKVYCVDTTGVPCDKKSVQIWTRYGPIFWVYNIAAAIYCAALIFFSKNK